MARVGKSYAIREAGTANRLGKVWKTYPYSLRSLLEALDDEVIRRYEHGEEAWSASTAEVLSEHGNDTQG